MQGYSTELPLLVSTFPSPTSRSICKYIGFSFMALYFLLQHIWSGLKAQWNQWSQPLISPSYLSQMNVKSQNFSLKCPGEAGRPWDGTNTQPPILIAHSRPMLTVLLPQLFTEKYSWACVVKQIANWASLKITLKTNAKSSHFDITLRGLEKPFQGCFRIHNQPTQAKANTGWALPFIPTLICASVSQRTVIYVCNLTEDSEIKSTYN